jgi:hypothetical protein
MDSRKRLGLAVLLVCACLLPALQETAFSQEKKSKRLCPKCQSTGKIPNPFMTEKMLDLEKDVLFCSYVIEEDKTGRGIPWLPCKRCRNPDLEEAARKAFEKLLPQKMKWLEERKENAAFLKTRTPLLHLETEHFILTWNVPKITTADRKTYKCHEAMHLYATRLETFYADFMKTLDLKEEEMRNRKHLIYLFEDQKSCLKAAQELTGLTCWNAAKLPGNPSVLVSWKDITNLKTDDSFHRHVVHHVSHLPNVAYYLMEWLAVEAGWADEGLAHYFEQKYFKIADNTCDEEGEGEEFSGGDWEVDVRKALETEKAPSFADLSIKSTTALHEDEHKFAWSYVDFLLDRDPRKFKLFMKAIKTKKKCRDALKESYGLTFIGFQSEWEKYVLDNYRKKPLSPTRPRRLRR